MLTHLREELTIFERVVGEPFGPALHIVQRAIPERVDLHRFPTARRHYPIIHLRVHPGELYARCASMQQAIGRVHTDAIERTAYMPRNNIIQGRVQFLNQRPVMCGVGVRVQRVKHPQRGIGGVIFWRFTAIGETIGDQSFIRIRGEGFQQPTRLAVPAGTQQQSRQGNHAISPPIREPWIPGNNGFAIRRQLVGT